MRTLKTLAVIVGIAVMFFASPAFAADSALKITGVDGKVLVKISPSAEWVDAKLDQALNPKDAIKTGENGKAMLEFSDKSTVALRSNTEVAVEELVWNDTAKKAGLNMPVGELRAMIKKVGTPSEFKVRTPTAICGARGTIFYILVTGTETRVFVTEGSVDLTNPESGNTYVVVENMTAISDLSGTVSEPRELTGEEKEQALAGWDGVIAETYIESENKGGENTENTFSAEGTGENPGEGAGSPI